MRDITIIFWTIYIIVLPFFIFWAVRKQIRRTKRWRKWEVRFYLKDIYKVPCPNCKGSGYESYTPDGEPNGEICEPCDSYGYFWKAISPPKFLKHKNTWTQTEIDKLRKMSERQIKNDISDM